jgi:hypothetical protein
MYPSPNSVSTLVGTSILRAANEQRDFIMGLVIGGSAGLEEAGASRIGKLEAKLSETFGPPTKEFIRESTGALQKEWTNIETGVKHILAGPETHELTPGGGPVEHYNYEQQRPTDKPGRFETTNKVHLDAKGNPIAQP